MSEKISVPKSPEQHHEIDRPSKQEKETLKHLQEQANRSSEKSKDEIKAIQKSIENAAISGKEYSAGENEASPSSTSSFGITRAVKKTTYKRTLRKAQSKLPAPQRVFSKVVHNPVIEKTSDVAAKTVARPGGLLFGGVGAFIGSVVLFYISKRTGFSYNYLFFILVFIGCYLFGIILELILQLFKSSSNE